MLIDRAKAALSAAKKEGKISSFYINVGEYDNGKPVYCKVSRISLSEGDNAFIGTRFKGEGTETIVKI